MSEVRTGSTVAALLAPAAIAGIGIAASTELADVFSGGGTVTWLAVVLAAVGIVVVALAGLMSLRGRELPPPLVVGLAVLPWIIGASAALSNLSVVTVALAKAAPDQKAWLASSEIISSFHLRAAGAYATAVVLLALAVVRGIVAFGSTRTARSSTSAGLALAGALFAYASAAAIHDLDRALLSVGADTAPELVAAQLSDAARAALMRDGALLILVLAAAAHLVASRTAAGRAFVGALVAAALLVGIACVDFVAGTAARSVATSIGSTHDAAGFEFAPAPRHDEGGRFDGTIGRADVALDDAGLARLGTKRQGRLGIALDRRLSRLGVELVFAALARRGVVEVDLFGESPVAPEAVFEDLGPDAVIFGALSRRRAAVRIQLQKEIDPGALRANVSDSPTLAVSSRVEAFDLPVTATTASMVGAHRRVFVHLRDPAAVIELMRAAEALSLNGFRAVVAEKEEFGDDPITEIVEANLGRFIACYRPRLKERPDLTGKVVVEFDVRPNGWVARSVVKSSDMGDPPLEKCLAEQMKTLDFPNTEGDLITVSYPFFFD